MNILENVAPWDQDNSLSVGRDQTGAEIEWILTIRLLGGQKDDSCEYIMLLWNCWIDCIQKMLCSTVKGMNMISSNTQVGPKWAIKYLQHHQHEPSIQGRQNPCFHDDYTDYNLFFKLQMDRSGTRFGLLPEPICFMFQRVLRPATLLCISQF